MMRNDFENPFGLKTTKGKTRMMSSLLDSGVFPGTQGGPLEHIIGAKAIAFEEALSDDYMNYAMQVKKNASVMADELIKKDLLISFDIWLKIYNNIPFSQPFMLSKAYHFSYLNQVEK